MRFVNPIPMIRAHFANTEAAEDLQYRHDMLSQALKVVDEASRKYSDYPDSDIHIYHYQNVGLCQEPKDVALLISTDGAQLTMKKKSDTWFILLQILNFASSKHYKLENILIPLIIPGPNNSENIESFLVPLFEALFQASEEVWMWNVRKCSPFVCHVQLCGGLEDML